MSKVRLGLDVDGVLANFCQAIIDRARILSLSEHFPCCWQHVNKWWFSEKFGDVWDVIKLDHDFWLGIPPFKSAQTSLEVVPDLYLTSRPVPNFITEQWLIQNGFPKSLVVTVTKPEEKLGVIRSHDINLFVDDLIPTVELLRESGVASLLYNAPYQCERDTSHLPRIYSLRELNPIIEYLETKDEFEYAKLVV